MERKIERERKGKTVGGTERDGEKETRKDKQK